MLTCADSAEGIPGVAVGRRRRRGSKGVATALRPTEHNLACWRCRFIPRRLNGLHGEKRPGSAAVYSAVMVEKIGGCLCQRHVAASILVTVRAISPHPGSPSGIHGL